MLIADAQVHIWAPNTPERPWRPGQEPHRAAPLGADELLRKPFRRQELVDYAFRHTHSEFRGTI